MGLSTLAVFLSLLFWGYSFGSMGMLLAVPLTLTVKILLQSSPGTRWVAVLLDSKPPQRQAREASTQAGLRPPGCPADVRVL